MLQSEQLDTRLILAADDDVAAGLLIQRLPVEGEGNLRAAQRNEDEIGLDEASTASRMLAATPDARRAAHARCRHDPAPAVLGGAAAALRAADGTARASPAPARATASAACCTSLGREEVDGIIAEQGRVEVGCEFCGLQYHFDPVDVGGLFTPARDQPPGSRTVN